MRTRTQRRAVQHVLTDHGLDRARLDRRGLFKTCAHTVAAQSLGAGRPLRTWLLRGGGHTRRCTVGVDAFEQIILEPHRLKARIHLHRSGRAVKAGGLAAADDAHRAGNNRAPSARANKHGPRSGARARRVAAGGELRATARGRCTIILGGTTRTKPRAGPRCPAPRFGRRASGAALAPCPARASARARHARSQPNPAPGAGRGTRISSRDHDALAGLELGRLRLERHIRAPGRHACCLLLATEEHVVPKRIHSFP